MKHINNKLKISLFGETWKLKQIIVDKEQEEQWLKIADRLRKPLYQAVIDPFFYHFLNDKKYKSLDDIKGFQVEGLINNSKNQIEIWYQGFKIKKFKMNELDTSLLLFPLYNVEVKKMTSDLSPGIYVEQREIGLYGNFQIPEVLDFSNDDLVFKLFEYKNTFHLEKLQYQNEPVISKKRDTIVVHHHGFEVL